MNFFSILLVGFGLSSLISLLYAQVVSSIKGHLHVSECYPPKESGGALCIV